MGSLPFPWLSSLLYLIPVLITVHPAPHALTESTRPPGPSQAVKPKVIEHFCLQTHTSLKNVAFCDPSPPFYFIICCFSVSFEAALLEFSLGLGHFCPTLHTQQWGLCQVKGCRVSEWRDSPSAAGTRDGVNQTQVSPTAKLLLDPLSQGDFSPISNSSLVKQCDGPWKQCMQNGVKYLVMIFLSPSHFL